MRQKAKSLFLLGAPIILILIFSVFIQATFLSNREYYIKLFSGLGPIFILVYILFQALAIIIAPIGGFVGFVTALAILGPFWGLVLSYLVSNPTYIINFLIAQKFGRPWVEKLVGKQAIAKIDQYAKNTGPLIMVILRIFQGGYFDYISYAAGLTSIKTRTFIVITFLGGIPGTMITYLIFSSIPNFTVAIAVILVMSYLFIGLSIVLGRLIGKGT